MPEKVPLLLVAQNVSKQVPKMPLRVGHSITYSSLVADICKKSLMPTDDSQLTPPEKPLLSTLNEVNRNKIIFNLFLDYGIGCPRTDRIAQEDEDGRHFPF